MGTTSNYSWPYPESSDYVADGATAIENLADAIDTTTKAVSDVADSSGMVLLKSQSVGWGVSSVTVTGAFVSTYSNYRVIYSGAYASVSSGQSLNAKLSSSHTAGYYGGGSVTLHVGTHTVWSINNGAGFTCAYLDSDARGRLATTFDVTTPYESDHSTTMQGTGVGFLAGATWGWVYAPTATVTDIYFYPTAGVLYGGVIKVYGYR